MILSSFLVLIAQLHDRIGDIGKTREREIGFCWTKSRDKANFNNFREIWFRDLGAKSRKYIPRKFLPTKICALKVVIQMEVYVYVINCI